MYMCMSNLVFMNEGKTVGEALDILIERLDAQIAIVEELIEKASATRLKIIAMRDTTQQLKTTASGNNWIARAVPQDTQALLEAASEMPSANKFVIESGIPLPVKPEPMWRIIERTMSGRERFTMTEAGKAIEGELGRSLGKNRPQTVRNNL